MGFAQVKIRFSPIWAQCDGAGISSRCLCGMAHFFADYTEVVVDLRVGGVENRGSFKGRMRVGYLFGLHGCEALVHIGFDVVRFYLYCFLVRCCGVLETTCCSVEISQVVVGEGTFSNR